jgi:hypothetical protein
MTNPTHHLQWRSPEGELISCTEKLKVLRENLQEIQQVCQDAFEDALLMGCDEDQVRAVFTQLIADMKNPYKQQQG